jgi:hypothetical protein
LAFVVTFFRNASATFRQLENCANATNNRFDDSRQAAGGPGKRETIVNEAQQERKAGCRFNAA